MSKTRKTAARKPLEEVICHGGVALMQRGDVYAMMREDGHTDFIAGRFAFRGEALDVPAAEVWSIADYRAFEAGMQARAA